MVSRFLLSFFTSVLDFSVMVYRFLETSCIPGIEPDM
jgi:hypothetical protein